MPADVQDDCRISECTLFSYESDIDVAIVSAALCDRMTEYIQTKHTMTLYYGARC